VGGLKHDIRVFVKVFKLLTLDSAFECAFHMEGAFDTQYRKIKFLYKPTPSPTSVLIKPNPQIPKFPSPGNRTTLIEQRRSLGQCFKCGDKYFPDHQCKVKVQILLGQEQYSKEEENLSESVQDASVDCPEEAIVSMYATHTNPYMTTIRFKRQVGTKPVYALLDSGSTHSFVDPLILIGQKCTVVHTNPLIVAVAKGEKMVTYSKCTALHFTLQGQEFTGELRLLQVQGYDMILGLDWLSQFGPMVVD
jgi:Retroviral aspartyl protease